VSLNYTLDKIANWEDLMEDFPTTPFDEGGRRPSVKTATLIRATVPVGLGSITESNAAEFYARLKMVEQMEGALMYEAGPKDYFFKPEDVLRHVGLSTNVSRQTRASWLKQIGAWMDERAREIERIQMREAASA
jgi:hypothetical protein